MVHGVTIRLLLDNGGAIEGTHGGAKYVSFARRIERGQLSEEEKADQLRKISNIYHRLAENAKSDTKRGTDTLVEQNDVQVLPKSTVTRATRGRLHPTAHELPPPLLEQKKEEHRPTAAVTKVAKKPSSSKQSDLPQRINQGRRKTSQKKTLKQLIDIVARADSLKLFRLPVTEEIAHKYHDFVHNPMDLQTIRLKLDKSLYEDEASFKKDMDLIFYNCELYNGLQSDVAKHGLVVKQAWDEAWEQHELCSTTEVSHSRKGSKRQLEGVDGRSIRSGPSHGSLAVSNSKAVNQAHPNPKAKQVEAGHKRSGSKARRRMMPSSQATRAEHPPMKFPKARADELLAYLGECDEAAQQDVIGFLKECNCEMPLDDDGDIEFDINVFSDDVKWRLDEHMRTTSNGQYNPKEISSRSAVHLVEPPLDEETDDG